MKKKVVGFLIFSLSTAFLVSGASANLIFDGAFNETSSPLVDLAGTQNNGTWFNPSDISSSSGITKSQGDWRDGLAYDFSSGDGYVVTENNIGISGSSSRAMCFWATDPGSLSSADWAAGWGETNTGSAFGVDAPADGQWRFVGWGNDFRFHERTAGWQHICVTFDGSTTYAYHNGTFADSASVSLSTSDTALRIAEKIGTSSEFWDAKIDELKIYTQNLSSTEVSNLYTYNQITSPASNSDPSLSNPDPSDGATDVSSTTDLSIDYSDSDGDTGFVEFYNASTGTLIENVTGVSAGSTASTSNLDLGTGQTVDWYATAHDGNGGSYNTSQFSFTTQVSSSCNSLKIFYRFDSSSVPDYSGCGNDGVIQGNPTYYSSTNSYGFGGDDYLETNDVDLAANSDQFSVHVEFDTDVQVNTSTSSRVHLASGGFDGSNTAWEIFMGGTDGVGDSSNDLR